MRKKPVFKEKWLFLVVLLSMIPLFQNMSPFESSTIDIRDIAPRKPAGNWNSDYGDIFPKDWSGVQNVDQFQSEILGHNFSPMLKSLEERYLTIDSRRFGGESIENSSSTAVLKNRKDRVWALSLVSSDRLKLMYLDPENFGEVQFSMETTSRPGSVLFNIRQPMNREWGFGISHETEYRQSRVQLDYRW